MHEYVGCYAHILENRGILLELMTLVATTAEFRALVYRVMYNVREHVYVCRCIYLLIYATIGKCMYIGIFTYELVFVNCMYMCKKSYGIMEVIKLYEWLSFCLKVNCSYS